MTLESTSTIEAAFTTAIELPLSFLCKSQFCLSHLEYYAFNVIVCAESLRYWTSPNAEIENLMVHKFLGFGGVKFVEDFDH